MVTRSEAAVLQTAVYRILDHLDLAKQGLDALLDLRSTVELRRARETTATALRILRAQVEVGDLLDYDEGP